MISHRFNNLKKEYDVIIIGGGIYGATLLWEVTLKGLSAVLVEKNDFCSATSANSLKIIHGGLRYLQSLDVKRIRESFNEQKYLLNIAPHLIQPLACVIPTYSQIKNSKFAMGWAFKLYELICFSRGGHNRESLPAGKILSKNELHTLIPLLKLQDATGGALWYDALNYNSERLTLEFILSACECGADAFNYLEFRNFLLQKDTAIGIQAYDTLSRLQLEIRGRCILNATGPWINKVWSPISPDQGGAQFQFAKAVNLIIPRKLSDFAFGLKASLPPVDDCSQHNRFIFFVPWRGSTMIGTWYFAYNGSAEEVALTEDEYSKCILQINHLLPDAQVQKDEICFVHKGLVPIDSVNGNKKIDLKNHYTLIDHYKKGGPNGVISVLGVKYTTARNVAAQVTGLILKKLNRKINKHDSGNQSLAGGDIENINNFIQEKSENNPYNLTEATVRHLVLNFGAKYNAIEKLIIDDQTLGGLIPGSDEAILAELLFCIKNELVYHLSDLLIRRTDIGSLKKPKAETINFCADFMAKEMGWSESQKNEEINSLINFYSRLLIAK